MPLLRQQGKGLAEDAGDGMGGGIAEHILPFAVGRRCREIFRLDGLVGVPQGVTEKFVKELKILGLHDLLFSVRKYNDKK